MSLDTQGALSASSPAAEEKTEIEGAITPESSTAADSSNADDQDAKPVDLLSVVKDAVKKDEPAATDPSAVEGEGEAKPAEAEPKAVTPEEQAEADKKLPFHEHPRWQQVMAENRELRDDAGRFRQVESFMQEHGLTGDEVSEGFTIMAKLKSGTPEGLAEVREYFATRLAFLDDALGNVLPDDLRQKVEAGELDEDTAKETARLRAATKLNTVREERRTEADEATRAREAAEANAVASATAVNEWEERTKQADPDYAKKAVLVETTCRAIVQEKGKAPANPKEAVELVKEAYARVNDVLKGALPKPKPVVPTPRGSSAAAVSQPNSLLDAVKSALAK